MHGATAHSYLATTSGWKSPALSDINLVSSGMVFCSSWKPGVFVSGGQQTDIFIL